MTYKQFSIKLAKQAGEIIRQNFQLGMKKVWKANETPVTKTDLTINKMVIREVKKYFPGHDVLGEEQSHRKNGGKYLWVCDPVDGTVPFSHGVPTCVFSLALVYDGRPIAGVVYDPFLDRLVYAEKGKGAFFNGRRTTVNKQGLRHGAVGWCSNLLALPLMQKYPYCFSMNHYSFIYDVLLVAIGELSGALYTGPHAHDGATAKIIVEEAGGKVTDLAGREQRYDGNIRGCLVTNKLVHKQLVAISRRHPVARSATSPKIF
ncbi:MAG: inositol monophosphatase [Patescibacteria group bacterium]|nr:inositol monophosphatase [Patescibacteria group bacterium]